MARKTKWVQVYECLFGGHRRLVRTLSPVRQDNSAVKCWDRAENRPAQSARIYLFLRKLDARTIVAIG